MITTDELNERQNYGEREFDSADFIMESSSSGRSMTEEVQLLQENEESLTKPISSRVPSRQFVIADQKVPVTAHG